MAEKRKLPPRAGREPAAKRRVSEAATPAPKKKPATPRVPTPPPEPVEAPLPAKMKDGDPVPIVRVRQPSTLSDKEYQSIAERFDPLCFATSVYDTDDAGPIIAQYFSHHSSDRRRNG